MKRQRILQTVGLATAALLIISACTIGKPEITIEAPEDGSQFVAGYDVHFATLLVDSLGLKSYSIEITGKEGEVDNSDCVVPFSFKQTWDLRDLPDEKLSFQHHHEIIIAENAAPGNYIFTLSCKNKAGRKSTVSKNIIIITPASLPAPF